LRACALAALLAASGVPVCEAQSGPQNAEYSVKAAFLYKFCGYVEWPARAFARPDDALVIGVAAADALAEELSRIVVGRTVNGHPVTVRKLKPGDTVAGLHVVFVGRADNARLIDTLAASKGRPVVTVTESERALELGSMINFVVVENKVRFDVALQPAQLSELKISARLLAVARKVISAPS
jgi:hypothetical protein